MYGNKTTLNQSFKEEITWGIRKYLEKMENENTTYQYLWNAVKAVLGENFIVLNVYIKKDLKSTA